MSGAGRWRWAHVLEHVPTTRGYSECGQVSQIGSFSSSASENIHGVVNNRGGVAFACKWDITYTIKFGPTVCFWIKTPHVAEPVDPVGTAKSSSTVNPCPDVSSARLTGRACRSIAPLNDSSGLVGLDQLEGHPQCCF